MEKLYTLRKVFFIFFIGINSLVLAQNNFVVFKIEGDPILKTNDTLRDITKGSEINDTSILTINNSDTVMMINRLGSLFKVERNGIYSFENLLGIPSLRDDSSLTKKYFSYVWNQFTNKTKNNIKGGVVYRVDNNSLMFQPSDSVKIYFPEIKFMWRKDVKESKTYYFILKDLSENRIVKIGASGNEITLFVDNKILKRGNMYEWTVSDIKYPNLNETIFYNFELLNEEKFNELKSEINTITTDLQKLGFNPDEIKIMLCEDYRICY